MDVFSQLGQVFRGRVLHDAATLAQTSRDASAFAITPRVVVQPTDAADIGTLVKFVNEHPDEHLSLTVRSGGTDMSGGALSESVIVDTTRLNRITGFEGQRVRVQPGMWYRDFERATLARDLLMPSYPASRELCTVGGMVANNAGGEKSLKYGKTEKFVHSLRAVFADGREYTIKPLRGHELESKKQQQDFEGEMYRKMFDLVIKNQQLITKARPKVTKNSAGYALWDVWDGTTFDLAKLFVGSQGTLGIITEIEFDLMPVKAHSAMAVAFLPSIDDLPKAVDTIRALKPESIEFYDDKTLWFALRYFPELARQMGAGGILKTAIQFIPELWQVILGGIPKLILLAEWSEDDQKVAGDHAAAGEALWQKQGLRTRFMPSAEAARKYWTIRRESFNLLRKHVRGRKSTPFIDDIAVPVERLVQLIPRLEAILAPYHLTYAIMGHAGDGNLHVIPLMDAHDPHFADTIETLSRQVYDLTLQFGGSITAEHNDGIVRTPFLEQMFGEHMYDLFRQTKKIFDPRNIFNPGKKVGGTWEYARQHLFRS